MGRPRKPTATIVDATAKKNPKRLRGRATQDPAGKWRDPDEATPGLGDPPPSFTDDERRWWAELIEIAPPGVLKRSDRASAMQLCRLWVKVERGTAKVSEHRLFASLCTKFALNPSGRAALPAPDTPDKLRPNPFADLTAEGNPHVVRAQRYARAVVAGTIPACRWVRLACQRHLNDLAAAEDPGFAYRFDADRAERICVFAELFDHTKGHWAIARPGQPEATRIRLGDWQCFVLVVIWGWVERVTGHRRFRVAYVEVPRKNGKSIIAAIAGNYALAADEEFGAEVYSGATSEKQAWEVFRPAKLMALKSQDFRDHFGIQVNAKSMVIGANASRFEPIIGKPGDGASPSLALVDEFHEHLDATLYDTMKTGMGARLQPLLLVITTAGDNLAGPCYALHEDVRGMLEGAKPNDTLFGVIYTLDEADDWTSETALRKANPNFGVSVGAAFLEQAQREAVGSAAKQGVFKTKHLNVWVAARSAWMNMEWWKAQADPTLREDDFLGERCFMGTDLASKIDVASVVKLFTRTIDGEEHWYLFARHYVPESTVLEPERQHYQGWVRQDHLIATEGDEIDQQRIKEDIQRDRERFDVVEGGFDDWGSIKLMQELQAEGMVVIRVPQTTKHLSDPMKELEARTKSGRLHHTGDPVLTWMMSNVTAKEDANENVFPRKERRENKIDGVVAAIIAASRAVLHPGGPIVVVDTVGGDA